MRHAAVAVLACAIGLAGCAGSPPRAAAEADADLALAAREAQRAECPPGVASGSECVSGRDPRGATFWLVVPPGWQGTLVVHAHGGPELGAPRPERAAQDLQRWSVWSRAGYAYAASGFRQGGVAVVSAAEDTERARRLFVARFGAPLTTILHGQSWGAGVAARLAETVDAARPYDGVLLTSGVLGGGARSYDFRLDLRVVYQAVCGDHPRADEPSYPLWQGLPEGSRLTRAELARRVDACTGVDREPSARSDVQRRRLATILGAVSIEERSLQSHLAWATWHFQDIAFARLAGRDAFGNAGVVYSGEAPDGTPLDRAALRYAADPAARADFDADAGLTGRIGVPVLTLHAVFDPTAFVELESTFAETMRAGGSASRLVQAYTTEREHSYLHDAEYVAALRELLDWIRQGRRPSPASIAARCAGVEPAFDAANGCRFDIGYAPRPLATRVPPR